jgi:diaminohydroxyphosphoribosylaminopyrimidine deaminase / 5-amino-6-(5-phosphoribosylamino)uracil reductase
MKKRSAHEKFMREALMEAKKALGETSPNPAVGALLVLDGKIISRGHHRRAGSPHAEVECLSRLRRSAPSRAILYVTLEPCSTIGRTPACTKTIVAAGVRRVVVGDTDPNPLHRGRGIAELRSAGIEVVDGVLASECALINEGFNKWIQSGRPFVIAKCGMSLDGRLTRRPGESRWLTSATARRDAHELRAKVDAILIGAETLRRDDPRLTPRGVKKKAIPWRIVISRSGKLPRGARLFSDRFANRTLVYRNKSLEKVLRDLGKKEITSVLIEGGGEVLGQALDANLIDKVQIYLAALITGGSVIAFPGQGAGSTGEALKLTNLRYERLGSDICFTGYPCERS